MSMGSGPRPPADHPHPDLRIACSEAVFGWCLHSGRSFMEDGFLWTKMVETALLTVFINTLAAGMVSGGVVNVERSSPDPCELSCELAPEMLR